VHVRLNPSKKAQDQNGFLGAHKSNEDVVYQSESFGCVEYCETGQGVLYLTLRLYETENTSICLLLSPCLE